MASHTRPIKREQQGRIQRCGDDPGRPSVSRGIGVCDQDIHHHRVLPQETLAAYLSPRFFSDCFLASMSFCSEFEVVFAQRHSFDHVNQERAGHAFDRVRHQRVGGGLQRRKGRLGRPVDESVADPRGRHVALVNQSLEEGLDGGWRPGVLLAGDRVDFASHRLPQLPDNLHDLPFRFGQVLPLRRTHQSAS